MSILQPKVPKTKKDKAFCMFLLQFPQKLKGFSPKNPVFFMVFPQNPVFFIGFSLFSGSALPASTAPSRRRWQLSLELLAQMALALLETDAAVLNEEARLPRMARPAAGGGDGA